MDLKTCELAMASTAEISAPALGQEYTTARQSRAPRSIAPGYHLKITKVQACTSVRSIIAATPMGHKRGAAAPKIVRWCSFSIPFEKRIGMIVGHRRTPPEEARRTSQPTRKQFRECGLFALFNMEKRREEEEARFFWGEFMGGSAVGAGGARLGVSHSVAVRATSCIRAPPCCGVVTGRELAGCLACGHWIGSWAGLGSSLTTPRHDTP